MKRRDFLSLAGGAAATMALSEEAGAATNGDARWNILWISCEDISPDLGCYGVAEARTPHLDGLAAQGARFTNAFTHSGVCAPTRSGIITGMYPTTLGTCHMRCSNTPPDHVKCFPEYLRTAGYYCTNNSKTDYNFPVPDSAWDECSGKAHWRNRPDKDQPFFAVFNFTVTHESKVGTPLEKMGRVGEQVASLGLHDPDKADLPPYYPDTPLIRKHWAHYFDLITYMDSQAGEILSQLEEDGFAENTVVVYFSDHGVGLPRAKRWMYDSGIHVPLIVRWPRVINPGTVREDLVCFLDLAPTVLSVANVDVPDHMQGRSFLPERDAPPVPYIFAARDRMDERYDIIRAARTTTYKYIRNYEPYRPYDQYLDYPENWPVLQDMRRVERAGELEGPETLFFRDTKPLEELYDTASDPHELTNLADSEGHRAILTELREAVDRWMFEEKDLGLVPEMELQDWLENGPPKVATESLPAYPDLPASETVFGKTLDALVQDLHNDDPFRRLMAIKAIGLAGPVAKPALLASLNDPQTAVGHWGAVSLGKLGDGSPDVLDALGAVLGSSSPSVRLGAARALCELGRRDGALPVVLEAMDDSNEFVRLHAAETLEGLLPKPGSVTAALELALKDESKYVMRVAQHALEE